MPVFAALFGIVTMSSIGLPVLNGFVGEFLILVGDFLRLARRGSARRDLRRRARGGLHAVDVPARVVRPRRGSRRTAALIDLDLREKLVIARAADPDRLDRRLSAARSCAGSSASGGELLRVMEAKKAPARARRALHELRRRASRSRRERCDARAHARSRRGRADRVRSSPAAPSLVLLGDVLLSRAQDLARAQADRYLDRHRCSRWPPSVVLGLAIYVGRRTPSRAGAARRPSTPTTRCSSSIASPPSRSPLDRRSARCSRVLALDRVSRRAAASTTASTTR